MDPLSNGPMKTSFSTPTQCSVASSARGSSMWPPGGTVRLTNSHGPLYNREGLSAHPRRHPIEAGRIFERGRFVQRAARPITTGIVPGNAAQGQHLHLRHCDLILPDLSKRRQQGVPAGLPAMFACTRWRCQRVRAGPLPVTRCRREPLAVRRRPDSNQQPAAERRRPSLPSLPERDHQLRPRSWGGHRPLSSNELAPTLGSQTDRTGIAVAPSHTPVSAEPR
jgi:hypothetical protein